MDLLDIIAKEFNIPVINDEVRLWFFRTKGGKYYQDFNLNGYVALGWDLISPKIVCDINISKDVKKEKIAELYPDEKRPGLILGQLDVFYNQMKTGDLIIIPSMGGKQISIGEIGEIVEAIDYKNKEEDYLICTFLHKRKVTWIKNVFAWQDVYLFKALRAQQTITDITDEADLVLRNLIPVYISKGVIHLSFQKETENELIATDNVDLQYGLLNILDEVAELYSTNSFRREVSLKIAVGSPGFLELILPGIPTAVLSVVIICKFLIGKVENPDGSKATGLLAILTTANEIINDYHNRKKTDAEIEYIKANTRLVDAQTEKTLSEVEKNRAENKLYKANALKIAKPLDNNEVKVQQIELTDSGKTTEQVRIESESLSIPTGEIALQKVEKIISSGEAICCAASNNGLSFDGKKIEKLG